jgi:regulator of sigma E protease
MSAISFSLGIMNLLPIPGLDGGKILFTLIEMIRRKPVSREVEGTLTLAGFGLLILLMIVVTVGDVASLF